MQELRLVAVSEDGTYLVLATAGRGTRFTLPVDDRLRAAVRGHFSRLGQFEIEVESPLRPKEIQARIRSGETAEEIAESAGIPVERIRWFEGPVLQEREYMAQQAQRVTVRRPGESTPGPPLGETVEERLGRGGVDLEEVEWDSWKCEDNTWRVRLSFFDNGRPHAAEWVFDPRRRHVSPLDEVASRLTAAEWDEESLADTVTPLVPRRPAMKVVSGDRGIPAEPEQPGPGPLRTAEPRDYVLERGRVLDPHPSFPSTDPTPLREAAQLREAGRPRGPAEAAGGDTPHLRQAAAPAEAMAAREAAPARPAPEDPRKARPAARDHGRPHGTTAPTGTAPRDEPDTSQAVRPGEDADEFETAGDLTRPHEPAPHREATSVPETASALEAVQEQQEADEAPESPVKAPGDGAGTGDDLEIAAHDEAPEPGEDTAAPEAAEQDRAAGHDRKARPLDDAPAAAALQDDADASQAAALDEDTGSPAPREDASELQKAGPAASHDHEDESRDEAPLHADEDGTAAGTGPREAAAATAPADADPDETAARVTAPEVAAPGNDEDTADTEDAADERPAASGDEPGEAETETAETPEKAPAARKGSAGQRTAHRPPAKKKPAGRPATPPVQDKPAAASETPAAAQRPAARGRRKAKGKRASVPSWDEIMFGARRPE
ncbi:septation protein SepH [Actinomadura graeca]|uniref:septation protein SepH n=1 Tax=Actinomadura graeca TaxID=2750812 RepID=UPI001E28D533|nr:septation protein SepH [Actinomadura graeca]